MPSLLKLTVVSCAVAVANAKWIKGRDVAGSSWEPARETLGATRVDPMGWTPRPTGIVESPLENELRKRAGTSTCGYFAALSSSAAVICNGLASCVVNSRDLAVGCCASADVASCKVPTRCIESASSSLYTSGDNTILCASAAYPFCVTYSYRGPSSLYSGYTALGCGDLRTIYTVEYYPPGLTASSASSRSTSLSNTLARDSTSSSSSSSATTATSATGTVRGAGVSATESSTNSATSIAETQSSGTPIGPIVGGVVGGVAVLALIAVGIFFIVRRNKKNKNSGPPPAPLQQQPTGGYPQGPGPNPQHYGVTPPPMAQSNQQYGAYPPAGFAAADNSNRQSIAPSYLPMSPKSQYETSSVALSPSSVSPPTHGADSIYSNQTGYSPPPNVQQQQQQYNAYNAPQGQQYQAYQPQQPQQPQQPPYQQHPQQGHAMELPTERGDRELRELA